MSKNPNKSAALAAALVGGLALSSSAFAMTDLAAGYMLGADQAAKTAKPAKAEGTCGGRMFDQMDTNKDGMVSRAECDAHHDAMFKKADANNDGMISRSESASMMKSMHEGSCGGDKGKMEGKCGADKKKADMEGKCGEGKCGGMA